MQKMALYERRQSAKHTALWSRTAIRARQSGPSPVRFIIRCIRIVIGPGFITCRYGTMADTW